MQEKFQISKEAWELLTAAEQYLMREKIIEAINLTVGLTFMILVICIINTILLVVIYLKMKKRQ